jgi:unsaturated chondroitin disaccharide hydrolase
MRRPIRVRGDDPGRWDDGGRRLLERIDDTARQELEGFPNYADPETGAWVTSPGGDWTGGFWVGELWLACRATGSQRYAELAARWCRALRPRVASDTVWRSFLFYYGAALGDILLGDQAAAAIALEGARGLTSLYNQRASVLPLGTGTSERGGEQTVIDAVGPVSALLGWASEKTTDPAYRELAARHARRHIELCVRDDGSVSQTATFDPRTGKVARRYSHQGYSDESTWARAQAWAMLGFAQSARWLPEQGAFLDTAVRVADWWIEHVPDDWVAFWDFSDPGIPAVERDTSASAIAAVSLLKLAQLVQDSDRRSRYGEAAAATVRALVGGYLTPTRPDDRRHPGILTEGCYHRHLALATRNELIWGDYYLFEALQILRGSLSALEI